MSAVPPFEPTPALPAVSGAEAAASETPREPPESDPSRSPDVAWSPWTAPLALIAGVLLAAVAALVVDLPAIAFGVRVTSSHTPGGLVIADTFVQDLAFIVAAVYCAKLGARVVRSWQFGLRRPGQGWLWAGLLVLGLIVAFIALDAIWSEILHPTKEKLLETLGTKESKSLLVLSAALTCVVAPIAEEVLFRGYMFTALRNWRGTLPAALIVGLLFGGVHATSAPAADLVPLAALGFGLCLIYRYTGSLYPGIAAHALNNSIAFASLEAWNAAQGLLLIVCALAGVAAVALACKRAGLIAPARPRDGTQAGLPRPAA
jgi:membrane protease YdiL (CAAX protease family)